MHRFVVNLQFPEILVSSRLYQERTDHIIYIFIGSDELKFVQLSNLRKCARVTVIVFFLCYGTKKSFVSCLCQPFFFILVRLLKLDIYAVLVIHIS